jgi:hypothetical protein
MHGSESAKEYRVRAQHCIDIARDTQDAGRRLILVEMAQAWMRLADQAERNRKTDMVYVTPRRPKGNGQRAPQEGA